MVSIFCMEKKWGLNTIYWLIFFFLMTDSTIFITCYKFIYIYIFSWPPLFVPCFSLFTDPATPLKCIYISGRFISALFTHFLKIFSWLFLHDCFKIRSSIYLEKKNVFGISLVWSAMYRFIQELPLLGYCVLI